MTRALMLIERGFQDEEYVYAYYRMLEEGWEVDVASPKGGTVTGKFGVPARVNTSIELVCGVLYDAVVLTGGFENPDRLRMRSDVQMIVRWHVDEGKLVAAICHAPSILISAGVGNGRRMTGYDSIVPDLIHFGALYEKAPVVVDGNLITAPHYRDNGAFMKAVVNWKPENNRWDDAAHGSNF